MQVGEIEKLGGEREMVSVRNVCEAVGEEDLGWPYLARGKPVCGVKVDEGVSFVGRLRFIIIRWSGRDFGRLLGCSFFRLHDPLGLIVLALLVLLLFSRDRLTLSLLIISLRCIAFLLVVVLLLVLLVILVIFSLTFLIGSAGVLLFLNHCRPFRLSLRHSRELRVTLSQVLGIFAFEQFANFLPALIADSLES